MCGLHYSHVFLQQMSEVSQVLFSHDSEGDTGNVAELRAEVPMKPVLRERQGDPHLDFLKWQG